MGSISISPTTCNLLYDTSHNIYGTRTITCSVSGGTLNSLFSQFQASNSSTFSSYVSLSPNTSTSSQFTYIVSNFNYKYYRGYGYVIPTSGSPGYRTSATSTVTLVNVTFVVSKPIYYTGDSTTITVTSISGATYNWSGSNITTATNTNSISANPTTGGSATTYNYALSMAYSSSSLNTSQSIIVDPVVSITQTGTATSLGDTTGVTFTAIANNVSTYTWTDSKGRSYSNSASITYYAQSIDVGQTINFICTVTNAYGSTSTSNTLSIAVLTQAVITVTPTNPTYMYSDTLSVSSPVTLNSTYTIGYMISNRLWYGNGSTSPIPGQTGSSFTINNTSYTSLQQQATFTNSTYSYSISPYSSTIPVNLVNLAFTNSKPYIYTGTFITLSITNSTNINYSWFASPPPPSGTISGGSTYQITTTPDGVSDTTVINYICTTTANSNSNSLSPYTTVTIYPQASLASDRTITSVGDTSAYVNFTASANANSSNIVTYVWYWTGSQSGSISTGTTNTYQFQPTSFFVGTVNFYCIATNQYESTSTTNTISITVLGQAVITLTPSAPPSSPLYYMYDSVKSINGSIPLTATYTSGYDTASNQKWYGNPGPVQVATGVNTYTITSSTYTSYYETVPFTYGSYTVSPNPITSNSVSVTSTNIIFQITLGTTTPTTTTLNSLIPVYMYSGNSVQIITNTLSFTANYTWSGSNITSSLTSNSITANPTTPQTYTYNLTIKANSNVSILNTYQDITVDPALSLTSTSTSCYIGGGNVIITANANHVSTYSWKDSKGRETYGSSSSMTYTPLLDDVNQSINFQCTVTNSFGSTSVAQITIYVYSSVTMSIIPTSPILFFDTTTLQKGSITLQSQTTSTTGYTVENYQWFGNTNTSISGATSSTYSISSNTTTIYTYYAFQAQFKIGTSPSAPYLTFIQKSQDTQLTQVGLTFSIPRPIIYVNANETSTISITGGYSYTWSANTTSGVNPNILSGASTNSITIQPSISGILASTISMIYYVNVTNNNSSTLSTSTTITIDPQVVLSYSQPVTSVNGPSITISATASSSPSTSYSWIDSKGRSTYGTSNIITYTPLLADTDQTITFTCTATNFYGSSSTNNISIRVLNEATITITPSTPYFLKNSSLSQNGQTILTANYSIASGTTAYSSSSSSRQWYGDGSLISGATSITYTINNTSDLQFYQNATLSYLITSPSYTYSQNVNSNNVNLTTIDFSLSPSKLVIYTGDTLTITATSYGYVSYLWSSSSSNAGIQSGTNTNVVSAIPTYPSLAPHTITYNLALSANSGAATLATSQTITVSPQVVLTATPQTTYLNNPTSVTLTASADGAISYAWSDTLGNTYSGTPITFTPTSAVNVTFTCTATNGYGSTTTNTILVKVLGEPTITLSPSTPYYLYDSVNAIYGSLTLSASYSTGYTVLNQKWYGKNPGDVQVGTGNSYVVMNTTYLSYYQQALFTSTVIPSYSTTITSSDLNINNENIVFTVSKPIIYTGGTLTIGVNNESYLTYQWSSVSSNANITGGATTYQVTAQPTNTSTVAQNIVYQIALSANSGVSTLTTSQTIEVDPQVYLTSPVSVVFIGGSSTTITANVLNATSYSWIDSKGRTTYGTNSFITYTPLLTDANQFITFTCTATNTYGSTTTNTYTLEVLTTPLLIISPLSPYFLKTSSTNGTTTLTGTFVPGLTFVSGSGQWYGDGNLIVGATNVSYDVSNTTYLTYYLTAILNDGTQNYPVTSQTVTLTTTTLSLSPNYTINYSTNPVIISLLAQQSYLTYLWSSISPNANIISGSTTYQVTAEPSVSSTEIIPYQVLTTANSGAATLTVIQNITILKELVIQIQILSSMPFEMVEEGNLTVTPNVVTLFYGNSIQLTAIADDVVSYEWFDDKGRSYPSTQSIIYTPDSDIGYVYISCKVTNSVGATQTRTVIIQILPNIIVSKKDITVYYTDEVYVKAIGGNSYKWVAINRSEYLPDSCYPTFDTDIMRFIPERDYEYQVTAYDGLGNESIGYVKITVIPKPMEVLQNDLIPLSLYEDVIYRRKNIIIEKLKRDTNLLSQLTQFYNVQLQSAYKMEFQSKQGRGYRVPWISKYQITNQTNQMLISFEQQYQLLRYLLNAPNCNLSFLINIIQYNFVLRSCNQPKDYYLQGPITR
jgi:hypothetical protein